MADLHDGKEDVLDVTPYLRLFIDKDGRWYQNGAEIVHPQIYALFNQALEKTPEGSYRIRVGREVCRVEVEDAPFVVKGILEDKQDGLAIRLNDGTTEPFDPEPFRIGKENIPYTEVRNRSFKARFSRPAYYQLARHITEQDGKFYLDIRGERTLIKSEQF